MRLRTAILLSVHFALSHALNVLAVAVAQSDTPSDAVAASDRFSIEEQVDRLVILRAGKPAAEFVFRDEKILRPYFANVKASADLQVTRNHPPVTDRDAIDHAENHPGVWLAFGDVSGHDFWRNKGRIKHMQFSRRPAASGDVIKFTTESKLMTADDRNVCDLTSRITLAAPRPDGWLLAWDATFRSNEGDFTFGDQEEMGFGARVATAFTESSGGSIVNSHGLKTAAATWGQPAAWCDYSGVMGDHPGGITLMAAPSNFRESWWHNRNYGVFVANPFGRAAMKQGEKSRITVKRGEPFRITFGAYIHHGSQYAPAVAYADFVERIPKVFTDVD